MFAARRVVGLGVLTFALIGCGGAPAVTKDNAKTKSSASANDSTETKATGELVQIGSVTYADWGHRDARDRKVRPLEAGDFFFKGTFIQGKPGQQLTLELKNVADQVHNFSLPAQGLDKDIPLRSDLRVHVDVAFPQSGELQFLCKYHSAQGMNGLLLLRGATPRSIAEPSRGASPQPAR